MGFYDFDFFPWTTKNSFYCIWLSGCGWTTSNPKTILREFSKLGFKNNIFDFVTLTLNLLSIDTSCESFLIASLLQRKWKLTWKPKKKSTQFASVRTAVTVVKNIKSFGRFPETGLNFLNFGHILTTAVIISRWVNAVANNAVFLCKISPSMKRGWNWLIFCSLSSLSTLLANFLVALAWEEN